MADDIKEEDLKKAIKGILKGADLDNLSTKKVRKQLEQEFDTDLTKRKKEIDSLVMQMITENDKESEEEADVSEKNGKSEGSDIEKKEEAASESSLDELDEEEEEVVPKKKVKKNPPAKRKSAKKADDSEDPIMSGIVEMNDEDLAKKLQEEESGLRRRGGRRPPPPPKAKKEKKEKDPEKKKKSAYSRPCVLSEALAAVLGTNEMARSDVVKNIWAIVKERNLQDPNQKQYMVCDEQFEALFGRKRLKTFAMMKYLKVHIKDPHLVSGTD